MYLLRKFIIQDVLTTQESTQRDNAPKNVYNNVYLYVEPLSKTMRISSPDQSSIKSELYVESSQSGSISHLIAIIPLWMENSSGYNSNQKQSPKIVYSDKVIGCRVSHSQPSPASSSKLEYGLAPNEQINQPRIIFNTGVGSLTVVMNFVFETPAEIDMFISEISIMGIECEKRVKNKPVSGNIIQSKNSIDSFSGNNIQPQDNVGIISRNVSIAGFRDELSQLEASQKNQPIPIPNSRHDIGFISSSQLNPKNYFSNYGMEPPNMGNCIPAEDIMLSQTHSAFPSRIAESTSANPVLKRNTLDNRFSQLESKSQSVNQTPVTKINTNITKPYNPVFKHTQNSTNNHNQTPLSHNQDDFNQALLDSDSELISRISAYLKDPNFMNLVDRIESLI
ncbi:hypothetical protein AYI68_g5584 [Smittium mucronatum]|uniref:Uncharacterized protein n=1 Tax=Smittium mucronatum TaxID=133383 RepID=A0A1R0GTW9_9FUNG|nr:hypothetical protein AYI68_g5584 [Smittium mucronatum]